MGLKWLAFLIGLLDLIGMWSGKDQRANIVKTLVYKILDTTSSNVNNYSKLNIGHDWEDICI